MSRTDRSSSVAHLSVRVLGTGAVLALLSACVAEPPPRPIPPPPRVAAVDTTVYSYPTQGQSPEQADRDRYECYVWASQQTGFDPSAATVPPEMRVRVVQGQGPPPGTGTAVGAVSGALLGAAVSNPWNRGAGALVGAIIGSAVGSTADAANASANAQRVQEARMADRAQVAQMQQQASNYRRALGACLEGRGYSVR
jgi:hypothetical protein